MKKGQAAMEFLMTYGWAIVIVLAAIGALAYFGVLSPQKLLPDRTTFPAPLPNVDNAVITATGNSFQIAFKNNKGVAITIPGGAGNYSIVSSQCTGNWTMTPPAGTIQNGDSFLITFACGTPANGQLDSKFKADVSFVYINTETTQSIRQTGSVEGKYT